MYAPSRTRTTGRNSRTGSRTLKIVWSRKTVPREIIVTAHAKGLP
jgi:hypothetical protein